MSILTLFNLAFPLGAIAGVWLMLAINLGGQLAIPLKAKLKHESFTPTTLWAISTVFYAFGYGLLLGYCLVVRVNISIAP